MTRHMRLRRVASGAILALFLASPAAADEREFSRGIDDRVALCNERPVACLPPKPARKKSITPPPTVKPPVKTVDTGGWQTATVSFYGPGLYGNNVGCKGEPPLTPGTVGVAHKTLPCGTKVTFRHNGKEATGRVMDRGPYVGDRKFDLTAGLCAKVDHCHTGAIQYKVLT